MTPSEKRFSAELSKTEYTAFPEDIPKIVRIYSIIRDSADYLKYQPVIRKEAVVFEYT